MVFKNVSYFSSDPYNMNLYDIEYIPYRVPKRLQNYGSIISHSIMYMYIKDTYRIDNKTKKKKIMKWFVYLNTFHKFSISLKKNSKEFFILFPYKSPSLCLLSRRRITHPLYQKCHRHTSNFYHSRKSDKSANRPGHRLISVIYVDVQIRSNSSRIRHAYLARLERLLEGVA